MRPVNCEDSYIFFAGLGFKNIMFANSGIADSWRLAVSVKVDLWIQVVEAMSGGGEVLGGDDARPAVVKLPVGALERWR